MMIFLAATWEESDAFTAAFNHFKYKVSKHRSAKTQEDGSEEVKAPTPKRTQRKDLTKLEALLRQRAILRNQLRKIRHILKKYRNEVKKRK